MSEEKKFDDDMRGALFAIPEEVRLKRGGKKAPAYEGRLMIGGTGGVGRSVVGCDR